MSFGSPVFLFFFLPLFFTIYFATPYRLRNVVLLLASLIFYWSDAGNLCWILIASVVLNQVLAVGIVRMHNERRRLTLLSVGVGLNLLPLIYYKYWVFLHESMPGSVSAFFDGLGIPSTGILLPAGISFFTFQGISYIVDAYRADVRPTQNIIDFGMYHTLFPQLIAGPIVRYAEVHQSIRHRRSTLADIHTGVVLFCLGLGCKIIIADSAGVVADRIFALPVAALSAADAWLGIGAYTLQIFFDFSGYSTMAIGLGRALGFHFPQNFDQPYRSQNITEFWRRWHMTLSRWFRDYLYIPLGGNRAGPLRTYLNLTLVFALCGLWHGASVTFLVWGLWHGLLLVIERVLSHQWRWRPSGLPGWAATLLLVMIGWVFFRSSTLEGAFSYLHAMVSGGLSLSDAVLLSMTPNRITFLGVGTFVALSAFNVARLDFDDRARPMVLITANVGALAAFIYSLSLIATNGFNPFIYFRF
ncbi:MBOAT family O-acyltransferase [Bosea sp. UNC402CLCol]|uniref:MBOAT family O-acyltransferase n=1 Tax=Bosea sp. UNC402CLCol TaxID=1510531 RepID=UPI0005711E9D|nr:MBOAT family O-acyltransferase [Bosea sp. UNC402CLCol]